MDLREDKQLPDYARSPKYWIITVAMILAGGFITWIYFGQRAEAIVALHVGISTPLILQKLAISVPQVGGSRNIIATTHASIRRSSAGRSGRSLGAVVLGISAYRYASELDCAPALKYAVADADAILKYLRTCWPDETDAVVRRVDEAGADIHALNRRSRRSPTPAPMISSWSTCRDTASGRRQRRDSSFQAGAAGEMTGGDSG